MRLFQFSYSPYAAKVRIVLKLKGLGCEIVEVPYTDRRELVAISGDVRIPVLVDDGKVISESSRIIAHLETKGGAPMLAEPLAQVLEQWADNFLEETTFRYACPGLEVRMRADHGETAGAMYRLIKERRYGAGIVAQWRADEAKYQSASLDLLAPLSRALELRPYLLGDKPTVADAAVVAQLHMVEIAKPGFVRRHTPGLAAWFEKLRA
jgi:glutathione S-transferase